MGRATSRERWRRRGWAFVLVAVVAGASASACGHSGSDARSRQDASAMPREAAALGASPDPTPSAVPEAAPSYDLTADERRGGHTIARHVGQSDEQLRERLGRERISAASTYTDLATAESVVAVALRQSVVRIEEWERRRRGSRANLALRYSGTRDRVIGRSLVRGKPGPRPCYDAVVVLRWDDEAGGYYVLTSYPEARQ